VIVTVPLALGTHPRAPRETSISKVTGVDPAQALAGMAKSAIVSWINFFISF